MVDSLTVINGSSKTVTTTSIETSISVFEVIVKVDVPTFNPVTFNPSTVITVLSEDVTINPSKSLWVISNSSSSFTKIEKSSKVMEMLASTTIRIVLLIELTILDVTVMLTSPALIAFKFPLSSTVTIVLSLDA